MLLVLGSTADITAPRGMDLNLPEHSTALADSGFLDLAFEAALEETS